MGFKEDSKFFNLLSALSNILEISSRFLKRLISLDSSNNQTYYFLIFHNSLSIFHFGLVRNPFLLFFIVYTIFQKNIIFKSFYMLLLNREINYFFFL
jgi:hypothetical protein